MELLLVPQQRSKRKIEENTLRLFPPPAVSETFSVLGRLIELAFDENEHRLKGPFVSSSSIEAVEQGT